jgi:hypothetical protein
MAGKLRSSEQRRLRAGGPYYYSTCSSHAIVYLRCTPAGTRLITMNVIPNSAHIRLRTEIHTALEKQYPSVIEALESGELWASGTWGQVEIGACFPPALWASAPLSRRK